MRPPINTPQDNRQPDSGTALQRYLDSIPVSSVKNINDSPVLGLKSGDSVKEAICLLSEKNVSGVLIVDIASGGFLDRYIGFIYFSDVVLWCLEEYKQETIHVKYNETGEAEQVAELAESFLWQPFFPLHLDDTFFHVLLLLSKHPLQVVPVVQRSTSQAIGVITQNAVIQMLLQSSGLEWFDGIPNKVISEFRIENEEHVAYVYGDQSTAEAFHILWKSRTGVIAVTDRENKKLIGWVRNSDAYLILRNETLLHNREEVQSVFRLGSQ